MEHFEVVMSNVDMALTVMTSNITDLKKQKKEHEIK